MTDLIVVKSHYSEAFLKYECLLFFMTLKETLVKKLRAFENECCEDYKAMLESPLALSLFSIGTATGALAVGNYLTGDISTADNYTAAAIISMIGSKYLSNYEAKDKAEMIRLLKEESRD